MKRVQHDEIKPGMKVKLEGHWFAVHELVGYGVSPAHAKLMVSYVNGWHKKPFPYQVYQSVEGYELHPQAALLDAQAHQRKGRAENVVLREYSIKFIAVDRVDNQGETCGYCCTNDITCNIYATVTTDSGRTEESAWSTCDSCTLNSIDGVEDVDPSHTITIERAARG